MSELSELRLWLLSSGDNLRAIIAFAAARDLLPALEYCLSRYGLTPPIALERNDERDGELSPKAFLQQVHDGHAARRAAMRDHLRAAVGALNAEGIEPLLLKGCASLWLDRDPWRQMRDMDLLVTPSEAEESRRALHALGFHEPPENADQRFGHHLPPLVRSGMPGWLEVHFRASNSKAEGLLTTQDLWDASVPAPQGECRAHVLRAPQQAMHGLVHNHFGHRSNAFGTINLKGLHEFVWAVAGMSPEDREALVASSFGSERLRAAFEVWSAAGTAFYRLALPPDWSFSSAAKARAEEVLAHAASGASESLVVTFMKNAQQPVLNSEEPNAGPARRTWSERVVARLKSIRAAAREIVVPWRDRESLRDKSAGIRR